MPAEVRAVVFKTNQLKATKDFFENTLKFMIREESARHFAVYSENIRLVFIESKEQFKIEMYVRKEPGHHPYNRQTSPDENNIQFFKDPNGIRVILLKEK